MLRPERAAELFAAELSENHVRMDVSEKTKAQAAAAWFNELHEYGVAHLPVGAGAEISEAFARKAVKACSNKMRNDPDGTEQKYGLPILLILGFLPTLFTFISWIVNWFRGNDE